MRSTYSIDPIVTADSTIDYAAARGNPAGRARVCNVNIPKTRFSPPGLSEEKLRVQQKLRQAEGCEGQL